MHFGKRPVWIPALLLFFSASGIEAANPWKLEAQYHFDERPGTTVSTDATGHGHAGTVTNVTAGVAGFAGTAYRFNGTSSTVKALNVPSLKPGTKNVRISVRFKGTSRPTAPIDYDLIKYGSSVDPGTSSVKMEVIESGQVDCGFSGSTGHHDLKAGPVVTDGAWHLIQCYKYTNRVETWIDGIKVGSKLIVIGNINPIRDFFIGSAGNGDFTKATLDEVTLAYQVP